MSVMDTIEINVNLKFADDFLHVMKCQVVLGTTLEEAMFDVIIPQFLADCMKSSISLNIDDVENLATASFKFDESKELILSDIPVDGTKDPSQIFLVEIMTALTSYAATAGVNY